MAAAILFFVEVQRYSCETPLPSLRIMPQPRTQLPLLTRTLPGKHAHAKIKKAVSKEISGSTFGQLPRTPLLAFLLTGDVPIIIRTCNSGRSFVSLSTNKPSRSSCGSIAGSTPAAGATKVSRSSPSMVQALPRGFNAASSPSSRPDAICTAAISQNFPVLQRRGAQGCAFHKLHECWSRHQWFRSTISAQCSGSKRRHCNSQRLFKVAHLSQTPQSFCKCSQQGLEDVLQLSCKQPVLAACKVVHKL